MTATRLLPADAQGIADAARLLRDGELVAFGTETVYGLGADATNERAVAAIFAAKGRPHFNPLIAHYPDAASVFADVEADDRARALAAAFWPGPLTLVLPRRADCPVALLAGAGLDTLAVRVPAWPAALDLLRRVGRPVAAPSANRSGQVSPTTAAHVMDGLGGRIAAVLDCGPCAVGLESSVLNLTGGSPVLLRPGGVTRARIEAVIGPVGAGITPAQAGATRGLRSPGLLVSHYAPRLPVRLGRNVRDVGVGEELTRERRRFCWNRLSGRGGFTLQIGPGHGHFANWEEWFAGFAVEGEHVAGLRDLRHGVDSFPTVGDGE